MSEVEEKYKKAMVSNAQLDNDKANLIYQVDTLKDVVEEMEEQMSELRRETEEKSKVHTHTPTYKGLSKSWTCGNIMLRSKHFCESVTAYKHGCVVNDHLCCS